MIVHLPDNSFPSLSAIKPDYQAFVVFTNEITNEITHDYQKSCVIFVRIHDNNFK